MYTRQKSRGKAEAEGNIFEARRGQGSKFEAEARYQNQKQ